MHDVNFFRRTIWTCVLLVSFFATVCCQTDAWERSVADYEVPYSMPTVEGIKTVCDRVKDFYVQSGPQQIIDRETGKAITDFSKPNENAVVNRAISSSWAYTHGVILSAFDYMSDVTGDNSYFDNNVKFFDFVFEHLPYFRKNAQKFGPKASGWRGIIYMRALDDCGSLGCSLIKTYKKHKDERYMAMIDTIAEYIFHKQFRLADGSLARRRPQPESLWADDLYMCVPFLAQMGDLTGKKKYFNDAVKQIIQISDRLFIKEKGIYDHGWNSYTADYDPRFYWGRANGWVLMAMAELLSVLPEDHEGRDQVLHLYRSHVRALANLQDGTTGFWHNLLDKTDTYLETSCTAMFVFGIAKGINEGWVSHVYGPVAQTGWNALVSRVLKNGAVDGTCVGTTYAHDNIYYYHRGQSPGSHGSGAFLYAGAEMIKLLQNEKLEIIEAKPNAVNSTHFYLLKSDLDRVKIFRGH